MKKIKLYKILLAAFAIVIAGVFYTFVFSDNSEDYSETSLLYDESDDLQYESSEETSEAYEDSDETNAELNLVCVHVCGCVVNSGIYYLESGSRIYDAIEASGGFSDGAAQSYLNLAAYLEDGMQIYVPEEDEDIASSTGVIPEAGLASSEDGLININTASADELTKLPGIGDTKAASIVDYRDSYGNFTSIDEIMNVSGIGESSYERIKDLIKV